MKGTRIIRVAVTVAVSLGAAMLARAAETGTLIRASALLQSPSSDAPAMAQLPDQTQLRILNRQGAWLQVAPVNAGSGASGWVKLLSVRTAAGSGAGDSGVGALFNVARSGSTGSAVATGVRGLSKVQVQNAVPNFAELSKLDAFLSSPADAQAFAQTPPPLQSQAIPYVKADGSAQ
jgi:hypothetical protein